jgi:hypothetical protein
MGLEKESSRKVSSAMHAVLPLFSKGVCGGVEDCSWFGHHE